MRGLRVSKGRQYISGQAWGFASGILLLALLVVVWIGVARTPYISNDFSYTAAVAVTRHEYDPLQQRYSGSDFATGNYSIEEVNATKSTANLKSTLTVNAAPNMPLGKFSHNATVDTSNGKFIDVAKPNAGFLFAPRNLHKGQSFTHQHLLYGTVATMHYDGNETIDGLTTFRYSSYYPEGSSVPTANITNAPLGSDQTLVAKPAITIWVEPQSGWLINYREDSTVYVANKNTGQHISPLYNFTASFTEDSVKQQVAYANNLQLQLSIASQLIPGLLILLAIIGATLFIMRRFSTRTVTVVSNLAVIQAVAIAQLVAWAADLPVMNAWVRQNIAINPLTCLCFLAITLSCTLLYKLRWRWLAGSLTVFVLVVCTLQILASLQIIGWQPDTTLFHGDFTQSPELARIRMSYESAVLFIILSIGLLKATFATKTSTIRLTRLVAGIVYGLAACDLILKLLGLMWPFKNSSVGFVTILEWFMFLLIAVVLFRIMQERHGHEVRIAEVTKSLLRQSVFAVPIIAIGLVAQMQQHSIDHRLDTAFTKQATTITQSLQTGLASYTHMLDGARTLFTASHTVERSEWNRYISALNLSKNYPGIVSIGYIQHSSSDAQALATIAAAQHDGLQNYAIFPAGQRSTYDPVLYAQPDSTATSKLLGFDMSTDTIRSQAMQAARDQDAATLSDATPLLGETSTSHQGFLMFMPVYTNTLPSSTATERSVALQGYVYAAFDATATIRNLLASSTNAINAAIYDNNQIDSQSLLYDTATAAQYAQLDIQLASQFIKPLTETTVLYADGHPWTLQYTATPNFSKDTSDRSLPGIFWLVGSGIYLLILLLLDSMRGTRTTQPTTRSARPKRKQKGS